MSQLAEEPQDYCESVLHLLDLFFPIIDMSFALFTHFSDCRHDFTELSPLNTCIPVLLKNVKNRLKNYVICIVYKLCLAVCFIVERNPSDVSAFIQMAQCVLWFID